MGLIRYMSTTYPDNVTGTISVDSDEPGESPTPISVIPPSSSPSPSPAPSLNPSPQPSPDSNQQDDDFTLLSDAGESLTGQSDIKLRMLGGNDFLEVTGGNNYVNGNMGEDTIILRGGYGEYLGGKDSDTIEVFGAEEGTSVNGNRGEDRNRLTRKPSATPTGLEIETSSDPIYI